MAREAKRVAHPCSSYMYIEKAAERRSYKKFVRRMLMKLTADDVKCSQYRRGGDKETNGLTSKRVHCDETGLNNEAELQNVNNQIGKNSNEKFFLRENIFWVKKIEKHILKSNCSARTLNYVVRGRLEVEMEL